MFYTTFLI